MMKIKSFGIISCCIFCSLYGQEPRYPQDYFNPPLEIPLLLSGTFGELRTNHFHSGIDIKTQGKEGLKVLATASGVVSRIKVSPYGFGKALYITHPNGYTTVYAHLKKFNDAIEEYVKKEQYQKQSYDLELFPSASLFPVEQGEVIAYSGNSGGSGGPHLHFEIRNTRTEKIINPLLFGFDVKDDKRPDLYSLEVYDFSDGELSGTRSLRLLETSPGVYRLTGNDVVEVNGSPAFGLRTFDKLTGAPNKNGVYNIKMWVMGELVYDFKMETFAFNETRYINSHIDYGQKICCKKTVNKLYLEPGNRLSVYEKGKAMNLPELAKDSLYDIKIIVSDVAGNTSELVFNVKQAEEQLQSFESEASALPVFKYNQSNFFKQAKLELILPENALYRDIFFEYNELDPCSDCLSAIYQVGAEEIPVHLYYTLKIKPYVSYEGDKSKLAIASLKDDRIIDYEGGKYENGFVTTRTRQFGQFAVVADTVAPEIGPLNFSNNASVASLSSLKVKVTDDLSGIDKYTPTIDGDWVLMEYDAKYDLLILDMADLKLEPGLHTFKLVVEDEKNNISSVTYSLKW